MELVASASVAIARPQTKLFNRSGQLKLAAEVRHTGADKGQSVHASMQSLYSLRQFFRGSSTTIIAGNDCDERACPLRIPQECV